MEDLRFVSLAELQELRGERDCALTLDGVWATGTLDALRLPCVAIVGTRAATNYGKRTARAFAARLSASGCCVVSGLALGVDSAAHEGALDATTPTVGVLGSGHHRFFPSRNRALAEKMIAAGGAILSPFSPDSRAQPHQFLQRNGVVAALADAVVVVEAPARSGALNTAGWAAGRIPVFAVPGDIDRPHVAGCHALLRDGAILARSADDVLEVLRIAPMLPLRPPQPAANSTASSIVRALLEGEADLDALVAKTGYPAPDLLAALAILEIEGTVERNGGRFASSASALLS